MGEEFAGGTQTSAWTGPDPGLEAFAGASLSTTLPASAAGSPNPLMGDPSMPPGVWGAAPAAAKDAEPAKKEEAPPDPEKVRKAASAVFQKLDGFIQDEKGALSELSKLSPAEIKAVREQFNSQEDGKNFDDYVRKAMDTPSQKAQAEALLGGDKVGAAKASLEAATKDGFFGTGLTTDHKQIQETLKNLSHEELEKLKTQMGPENIEKLIGANESGNDKEKSLAILNEDHAKEKAVDMDEAMHGGVLNKLADGVADMAGVDKAKVRESLKSAVDTAGNVMMFVPGMQLAAVGAKYLASDKGDAKSVEKTLDGITDPKEREKVLDDYKKLTGEEFDAAKDKVFSGSDKKAIGELEKGDHTGAKADELRAATEHFTGTNKDEIFKVFETPADVKANLDQLPPAEREKKLAALADERRAIVDRYNAEAKEKGEPAFDDMLKDKLGEKSLAYEKAKELEAKGEVPKALALDYALKESSVGGMFADKDAIKGLVVGKSKAEVAELRAAYEARPGHKEGDFDKDVVGAASGRDELELKQGIRGKPTTPEEMMANAREKHEFERAGGSSVLGYAAMAALGPVGWSMLAAGVKPSDISRTLTDSVSDSGKIEDANMKKLEEKYAAAQAGDPAAKAEMQKLYLNQQETVSSYGVAKDKVADQAATAAGLVVGTAATIATGGAASPLMMAMAAGAGGAATIATKAILKGQAYDNHELATDTAMMLANAASAGVMGKMGLGAGMNGLEKGALQGLINGGVSGVVGAGMDERSWRGNAADLMLALGQGGATGALGGAVQGGVMEGTKGMLGNLAGKLPPGVLEKLEKNPAIFNVLSNMAAGGVSNIAQTAVNPASYEGGAEAFLKEALKSGAMGAANGLGMGINDTLHPQPAHGQQQESRPPLEQEMLPPGGREAAPSHAEPISTLEELEASMRKQDFNSRHVETVMDGMYEGPYGRELIDRAVAAGERYRTDESGVGLQLHAQPGNTSATEGLVNVSPEQVPFADHAKLREALAHELQHVGDPNKPSFDATEDKFVQANKRAEGRAQEAAVRVAAEVDPHGEQVRPTGFDTYQDALEQAKSDLRRANPDAANEAIEAKARTKARKALENDFWDQSNGAYEKIARDQHRAYHEGEGGPLEHRMLPPEGNGGHLSPAEEAQLAQLRAELEGIGRPAAAKPEGGQEVLARLQEKLGVAEPDLSVIDPRVLAGLGPTPAAVNEAGGQAPARPISLDQAQELHAAFANGTFVDANGRERPLPWNHPQEGCGMRMEAFMDIAAAHGVDAAKIFAFAEQGLEVPSPHADDGKVKWSNHQAPTVTVDVDGKPTTMVVDPAVAPHPVPVAAWMANMGAGEHANLPMDQMNDPLRPPNVAVQASKNAVLMPNGQLVDLANDDLAKALYRANLPKMTELADRGDARGQGAGGTPTR